MSLNSSSKKKLQSIWLSEAIKNATTEQNKTWQNLKIYYNDNNTK